MVRFCRTCHLPFPAGELQNLKVQDLLKWIGFQTSVEDVQSMVRRQPSLLHCYMLGVVWVAWVSLTDVDSITDSYIYIILIYFIHMSYVYKYILYTYICVFIWFQMLLYLHLRVYIYRRLDARDGDRWWPMVRGEWISITTRPWTCMSSCAWCCLSGWFWDENGISRWFWESSRGILINIDVRIYVEYTVYIYIEM